MSDSSSDVLNDIDALLSKLKHLQGDARVNALSKLQDCLVEIKSSNSEGEKDTAQKDNERKETKQVVRKSQRKNKGVTKAVSKSRLFPSNPEVATNEDEAKSSKDINTEEQNEINTEEQNENSTTTGDPKRRLPALPNWFNNFSDVPQFLTTQNRSPRTKKSRNIVLEQTEIIPEPNPYPEETGNKSVEPELQPLTPEILEKQRRRRRKNNEIIDDDGFGHTCQVCKRTFTNPSYLRIHMRKHTGEKPFACEICDRKFTQKSSLWVHMKRHEGKYEHQCTECDYKTVLKIDLERHMPKHTGARVFICEQCGKMFTTDMRLKDHIRHVHVRNETHICDKCGFSTHRADNLRRHIIVKHSEDETFKCPVCGDVLKQRWTFIVHLRRHTGERPHVCAECGKGFKSLSQLAVHRRTHREGEHACPECNRKFKTKHHLSRHSVIHSGIKPYSCSYCPYTCNVKGNINKHMKAVHKLTNFSFKTHKKDQNQLQPQLADEQSAIARGQQVAQEFLQRMSMRKDEQLTIEELQQQLPKTNDEPQEPVLNCRRNRVQKQRVELEQLSEDHQLMECNVETSVNEDLQISSDPILSTGVEQEVTALNNQVVKSVDCENNDLLLLSVKQCLGDQMEMVNTLDQNTLLPRQVQLEDSTNNNAAMIYVIRVVP